MMMPEPLSFIPILKERVWGGDALRELFKRDLPPGVKIGESWELVDLPGDVSVIRNGRLAGLSIREAIGRHTRELTGRADFPAPFPLLVKLLDCREKLSVQVHPDAETCRRLGKGIPKTECWYIIAARPGAVIYKGLKEGVTRKIFEQAIRDGRVADTLQRVPVSEGECHLLPAGTPHTIGAGLLIAEIQTPSDTTWRVYDWDRTGAEGKARPLHIPEALASIHFDAKGDDLSVRSAGRLADSLFFAVDKLALSAGGALSLPRGSMRTMVCIKGKGEFGWDKGRLGIQAGDTVLLPAGFEGECLPSEDAEILCVTLP